jgi:hypothetical protein
MKPLDLNRLKVFPLAERKSLSQLDRILVDPDAAPPACSEALRQSVAACADTIAESRRREAGVVLFYGAHLVKNGLLSVVNRLIERGWITHLATNGAGAIHDWELAFLGRTEESVRENVATGSFGTWDETGRNINLSLLAGALHETGFGRSLGKFIQEDGASLPPTDTLSEWLREEPSHPLAPARAELLQAMLAHNLPAGRIEVRHPWKAHSILATAAHFDVLLTVHPGIGYDIIANHPMFNGAAIGRAAQVDFRLLGAAVEQLEGGVVLSVGSAIMAPQVFEKSVSCVNNLRLQAGRPVLSEHTIYVVDLQDGGGWDWSQGEPPKDHPAYYLRFCKSFSRMGGEMNYLNCDNGVFLRHLLHALEEL